MLQTHPSGFKTNEGLTYTYRNIFHMDSDFYDRDGNAPTSIAEIIINTEKTRVSIVTAKHHANGIVNTTYVLDKLKHITIATDILSGKISAREGFNKLSKQCRPGDNCVTFVIQNCNFIFQCLGFPFSEVKKRMISGLLEDRLDYVIQFQKEMKRLDINKTRKMLSLKDMAALTILKHANLFTEKHSVVTLQGIYERLPAVEKIFTRLKKSFS